MSSKKDSGFNEIISQLQKQPVIQGMTPQEEEKMERYYEVTGRQEHEMFHSKK
jgi:hypothetical protein